MLNVYRTSAEILEKNKIANVKEKTLEKKLNKWCRENFINYRSLRSARDIHRFEHIAIYLFVHNLKMASFKFMKHSIVLSHCFLLQSN